MVKSYSKEEINHLLIQQRKYKKMIRSYQENDCSQDYQQLQEKYRELLEKSEWQNHTHSETIKQYEKKNRLLSKALEQKERELAEWRQKSNQTEDAPADKNESLHFVLSDGHKRSQAETMHDSVAILFQLLYYLDQKISEASGRPLNKKRKEYDQAMDDQNPKHEPAASSTFLNHLKEPVQKDSTPAQTQPQEHGKPIPPASTSPNQQNPFQTDLLEKLQAEIAEMKKLMKEQKQSTTESESPSPSPKPRRKEPVLPQNPVANPYNPSTKQPQFNYRDLQGASVVPVIDRKGKKNHAPPVQSKKRSSLGTDTTANNMSPQIRPTKPSTQAIPTAAKSEQPISLKSEADKRAFLQKIKEQEAAKAAEKSREETAQKEASTKPPEAQHQKEQSAPEKSDQQRGIHKAANITAESVVNPESMGAERKRPQLPKAESHKSEKPESHTVKTTSPTPQSINQGKVKNQKSAEIKPSVQTEAAKKDHSQSTEEKKSFFKKFWDKVNF
ncbi:hypothetical protein [Sediminibacillus terrae]|uniref:hypothetical protein n=1 Tax=Sediminibacillus terrae TaxID=1562106 RepID=UPI001297B033|nr:hypothetical protein [Sediminibacillus terrae]